jgi:hypothetical protein
MAISSGSLFLRTDSHLYRITVIESADSAEGQRRNR